MGCLKSQKTPPEKAQPRDHRPYGVLCPRGPQFLEENGVIVTIMADRCCDRLKNFLHPKMEEHDTGGFWFQQDGATAYTTLCSRVILQEMFPGQLICLREATKWPPRCSDCDYLLWGYLKAEVFKYRPLILQELKEAIYNEMKKERKYLLHALQINRLFRIILLCHFFKFIS